MLSNRLAAAVGWLCAAPFVLLNFLAANQVESFASLIRPGGETSSLEHLIIFGSVLLMLLGGLIALSPARGKLGRERLPVLNLVSGILLIAFAVALGYDLGMEAYRCDVLGVSDCG